MSINIWIWVIAKHIFNKFFSFWFWLIIGIIVSLFVFIGYMNSEYDNNGDLIVKV